MRWDIYMIDCVVVDINYGNKSSLSKVARKIKYTDELIDSVNKYNDTLEIISQKILNLKIEFSEKDIEVKNLYKLLEKLSVINNIKSRKTIEKLLKNVIHEYGYQLQTEVDNMQ